MYVVYYSYSHRECTGSTFENQSAKLWIHFVLHSSSETAVICFPGFVVERVVG